MKSVAATAFAACLISETLFPAAGARAQAADPFPTVPVPTPPRVSHAWAYVTMASGLGLIGASYTIADRANRRYDEYLHATDAREIDRLYDDTVLLDRLSSGSLLTGEALIATGLYLRFLRRPPASRLELTLGPER